ncbi:MAG TPA: alpha/beta fold hydrolase [Rhizomicrobium sp.]|jgi:alpha-beta hydrolase superfamily lysophospholipase|nr:alpha/beta fold hydrolase [Rhizomicrobium sp.]
MTTRRDALLIGGALVGVGSAEAAPALWSGDYWAQKGDVRLYMYRKRLGAPVKGGATKPVLFLVHGSSMSSRSTFDVTVPGAGDYSMMNAFARLGYDVWTMDHEGYGRSSRTASNSDIASGAADLLAAAAVVARETGRARLHMMGESSGALRAALFAQNHPECLDRLVLSAFTYTGQGSSTLADRAKQLDFYRSHNRRPRDRAMIRSIFTRDRSEVYDMRVPEAVADAELPLGDDVPTGTYLDMTANLPLVDPAKIATPILLARGQYDGIASMPDLIDFFTRLPGGDNQFAVLPDAAHSLGLGRNRAQFWHVMQGFLSMPPDAVKPA